jgi:hypothetical protein
VLTTEYDSVTDAQAGTAQHVESEPLSTPERPASREHLNILQRPCLMPALALLSRRLGEIDADGRIGCNQLVLHSPFKQAVQNIAESARHVGCSLPPFDTSGNCFSRQSGDRFSPDGFLKVTKDAVSLVACAVREACPGG